MSYALQLKEALQEEEGLLTEALAGTVGVFIEVFSSLVTQDDRRSEQKAFKSGRAHNTYALGHLLSAVGQVRTDMMGLEDKDDAESLGKLKASITKRFVLGYGPAKAAIKQIDAFIATGKKPMIRRAA